MLRIRFHGRGGQGVRTSASILGTAAFLEGYYAQDFPIFGPERRGAPVVSFARISPEPIGERGYITDPDVVIVADESLLSDPTAQPLRGLRRGGAVFVNSTSTPNLNAWVATYDVTGSAINVIGKAAISAGIAAAASRICGMIGLNSLLEAIERELGGIGLRKEEMEANLALARECYQAIPSPPSLVTEPSENPDEELVELRQDLFHLSVPTIISTGNTRIKRTGNWRIMVPRVDYERCTACFVCYVYCPESCITLDEHNKPHIDYDMCKGCLICYRECPPRAISVEREVRAW